MTDDGVKPPLKQKVLIDMTDEVVSHLKKRWPLIDGFKLGFNSGMNPGLNSGALFTTETGNAH